MSDAFHAHWADRPVTPGVATVPLRDAGPPPALGVANDPGDAACRRVGVNDARNGRSAHSLPGPAPDRGPWRVERERAIDAEEQPQALLHAGERLVLESAGPWELYDLELQRLARGFRPDGRIALDPEHGLFHHSDTAGLLRARRLSDGAAAYALPLSLGESFDRRFVARRGGRMLVISKEVQLDFHGGPPPERSMIEVSDLGDPFQVDGAGFATSALGQGDLVRKTQRLVPALAGERLLVATEDRIYGLDLDLSFQQALGAELTPLSLSVDEAERVHLVALSQGEPRYWLLSLSGERLLSVDLPRAFGKDALPPLVARDHRVYLLTRRRLVAFDAQGQGRWEHRPRSGWLTGGIITGDDRLLLASGSRLLALDADGRAEPLVDLGEQLWTQPVVVPGGDVFVASRERLVRLTTRLRD